MGEEAPVLLPSEVSESVGFFDRFAGWASQFVGRTAFFAFCVVLVLVWAPTFFLLQSVDTWQLIINTITTIITFLMVALLQNSQTRQDQALQHKLNAIAEALAVTMEHSADHMKRDIRVDIDELRQAVGLEERESTTHNLRGDQRS